MNQEDIRILGSGALKAKILDLGLLKISLMDVFVLFLALRCPTLIFFLTLRWGKANLHLPLSAPHPNVVKYLIEKKSSF